MVQFSRLPDRPEIAAKLLAVDFDNLLARDNDALRVGAVLDLLVADDFGLHVVSPCV